MALNANSTHGFEKAWFVKALKKIIDDDSIFLKSRRKEAQLDFSIGSQKVEALQRWFIGADLAHRLKGKVQISKVGGVIYHYDPSLYEYGSWIIILHNLGSYRHTPEIVYWYLNEFKAIEFTISDFKDSLHQYGNFSPRYVADTWHSLKNSFKSTPFGEEFRLFEEVDVKKGVYRKRHPTKEYIHPLIFAYCIVDWAKRNKKETVLISDVVGTKGLPGSLLNLPERIVDDVLNEVDIKYRKKIFDVDRKAGLNRISLFIKEPVKLLEAYYEEVLNKKTPEDVIGVIYK